MNFRLSNGLKINSDVVSLANISITKDCDWGVLLVRNIATRAIRVKLSLNMKGNIHTSYSLSYRLAAVAASMAASLGWKRIHVIEETLNDSVVFRFRNYAQLSKNHAYDLPVLCTLSELMYVDSAGINSIPHFKRPIEHGFPEMFEIDAARDAPDYVEITNEHGFKQLVSNDAEQIPVCSQCLACVMPNRGQGMICDQCNDDVMDHFPHDDYFH